MAHAVEAPAAEDAVGMSCYVSDTPGIGGRIRVEPEDFQVIELGAGPRHRDDGRLTAARIRLRCWETNRFVSRAAHELKLRPGKIAFGGMKDKRAVTEQWFTFPCPPEKLDRLAGLQDVEVLEAHRTDERQFTGAHDGNRFVLRVRDWQCDDAVDAVLERTRHQIAAQGGVPNFFGPQRFGGTQRPVTARVGHAIIEGNLEEAVRSYLGRPVPGAQDGANQMRAVYEETRDAAAALAACPSAFDLERRMLESLVDHPQDWRRCLRTMPHNLLQLFVHAQQSLVFNRIVSARLDAGLGLSTVHAGDLVQPQGETVVHEATKRSLRRVQEEVDRGRAFITAPLPGMICPTATGIPGELEAKALEVAGIEAEAYRCHELPQVASKGTRRAILQPVADLAASVQDGDPVFAFSLGRGAYATVVLREFMKKVLE